MQDYSLEERREINVNVGPINFIEIYSCLILNEKARQADMKGWVCLHFRQKHSDCVHRACHLSLVTRLCTKRLTVALAAGLALRGESILALHKFLTRFQIADISILFSARAALYQQWDSQVTSSCKQARPSTFICCYRLERIIYNYYNAAPDRYTSFFLLIKMVDLLLL